jgi:microsomal dipeptidase-like Zn-dependent dipeptidase
LILFKAPAEHNGPRASISKGDRRCFREDYIAAIDYVIGIAGEDNIGIGTDFTQDQDDAFFGRVAAWGALRANWIYLKVRSTLGARLSQRAERHYPDVR